MRYITCEFLLFVFGGIFFYQSCIYSFLNYFGCHRIIFFFNPHLFPETLIVHSFIVHIFQATMLITSPDTIFFGHFRKCFFRIDDHFGIKIPLNKLWGWENSFLYRFYSSPHNTKSKLDCRQFVP